MKKLSINYSHQKNNPCAMGDSEYTHCKEYTDFLTDFLKAQEIELLVMHDTRSTAQIVNDISKFGSDLHYTCHTNAADGNATGSYLIYPEKCKTDAALLKQYHHMRAIMKEERIRFYSTEFGYIYNAVWPELNLPSCPVVYDEAVFHDNPEDAEFFHENVQKFAEGSAKALCRILGVTYMDYQALYEKEKSKLDLLRKESDHFISRLKALKQESEEITSLVAQSIKEAEYAERLIQE